MLVTFPPELPNEWNATTVQLYSYTVWTSVARPGKPMYNRGPISKIFWKSMATVCACTPKRRSDAIATQSLPFMATTAAPLYAKML